MCDLGPAASRDMSRTTNRPAVSNDRVELLVASEVLRRSNADLQRLRLATAAGFELLDQQTRGQLRLLVEQACDELAALVDRVLDARERTE
jgi:hypothetical protein